MPLMPVTDSLFLLGESREHPLHVGGLQLFQLPPGADASYVGELHRSLLEVTELRPLFSRRPRRPVGTVGQWSWTEDRQMDLEYHVRHSALPTPGRVRELLELVSRLHGSLLDRHRPLWESHLVEGLEGGRFAVYTKVHHSLLDGVSALRRMREALSEDPDARGMLPPWAGVEPGGAPSATGSGLVSAARAVRDVAGLGPAVLRYLNRAWAEQAATLPFEAPKSMLNTPITGARRFAAQGWPLERVRAVGEAAGRTVNDVMLAMCAGALRRYLDERGALPERPLVAAVPVSLRREETGTGGNAVGLILCPLATDLDDAGARLSSIGEAMRRGKDFYQGMSAVQVTALSAIPFAPLAVALLPGAARLAPPAFNLMISNIPGPERPLHYNGARLLGVYPVSVPYEGQALNITVTSYAGSLEFGLTGCRRSVPHLQRMLGHLEAALADLEEAVR